MIQPVQFLCQQISAGIIPQHSPWYWPHHVVFRTLLLQTWAVRKKQLSHPLNTLNSGWQMGINNIKWPISLHPHHCLWDFLSSGWHMRINIGLSYKQWWGWVNYMGYPMVMLLGSSAGLLWMAHLGSSNRSGALASSYLDERHLIASRRTYMEGPVFNHTLVQIWYDVL